MTPAARKVRWRERRLNGRMCLTIEVPEELAKRARVLVPVVTGELRRRSLAAAKTTPVCASARA